MTPTTDKTWNCNGNKSSSNSCQPNDRIVLQKYGYPFYYCIKENYKIYLDDYFILLNETTDKPFEIELLLNSINVDI